MLRDISFCMDIFFLYRRERGGGSKNSKALLYSGNPTSLAVNFFSPPRSISVSGQLPTYPSPNPTLTLTRYQLTVVELGEGTMFETTDPWYGWSTNSIGRNSNEHDKYESRSLNNVAWKPPWLVHQFTRILLFKNASQSTQSQIPPNIRLRVVLRTYPQHERKSTSESSEEWLSVQCNKSASCKLIGQFNRGIIGCKTQLTNHDGFAPLNWVDDVNWPLWRVSKQASRVLALGQSERWRATCAGKMGPSQPARVWSCISFFPLSFFRCYGARRSRGP